MRMLVAFSIVLALGMSSTSAQMLTEKPQSTGGDPTGIWETNNGPLKVYAAPELLATVSGIQFGGTISGKLTLEPSGAYAADYISTASVTVVLFGAPIKIDVADTNRSEGTYAVSGTQMTLTPNDVSVTPDTVSFTATTDSLHLVQNIPLGEYADLVGGLVPTAGPPLAVISLGKTGSFPTNEGPLTADFTGDGAVDFSDFLIFAQGFGKGSGDEGFDVKLDFDASGRVDFSDFLTFATQFGRRS